MTDADFHLSRVYAGGWKTALALSVHECEEMNPERAAALNPHTTEPERSRWADGFSQAIPDYIPIAETTKRS